MELSEDVPVLVDFTDFTPHPRETFYYLRNTYNNTGSFEWTRYPRDVVSCDTIMSELYAHVTKERVVPQEPVKISPVQGVYSHNIIKRNATFVVYRSAIIDMDYVKTLNVAIRYHSSACITLPSPRKNCTRKFVDKATTATFLILVSLSGVVMGYYRVSWVSPASACVNVKLASTPNTTHKYIACVGVPFFSLTRESIFDLNLLHVPTIPAGETESCVLSKFN